MGSALNNVLPNNPYATALSTLGPCCSELPLHGGAIADAVSGVLRWRLSLRTNRSESTTTTHCRQASSIVLAQGLVFTASYTFSKFLSDTGGPEEWGSINGDQGGSSIRNYYDLKADWSVDGDDIPQSLVLNYVYDLPVGRGKKFGGGMNRVEDAVAGGWQVSGITTAQSGFPMSIGPGGNSARFMAGVSTPI